MNIEKITFVVFSIFLSITFGACRKPDFRHRAAAIEDRSQMAALIAEDVTTLISDSGITRYRINAKKWLIYDWYGF